MNSLARAVVPLLIYESHVVQQIRTTFILKRRWPPGLHKVNGNSKSLRGRHYVYDLVKDTTTEKQPNIDIILLSYVEGFGDKGDRIQVKATQAYNKLLLPGLATYATPENIETYETKEDESKLKENMHSSPFAQRTVNVMSRIVLSIIMNKDVQWTLEPWHVRASFRKAGFHVAEDAIKLPSKSINGPDLSLEKKEFYVTVTVNNTETVNVRCRIHHWSTNILDRLPYAVDPWKESREPLFAEDAEVFASIPNIYARP